MMLPKNIMHNKKRFARIDEYLRKPLCLIFCLTSCSSKKLKEICNIVNEFFGFLPAEAGVGD